MTPTSDYVLSDDYIEVTIPSQFTVEATASCTSLSSNISAISCSVTDQATRVIKVGTTINTTNYASNKVIQFTLGNVQMPSASSATDSFIVKMVQTSGTITYEQISNKSLTFNGGYITPGTNACTFSSSFFANDSGTKITCNIVLATGLYAATTTIRLTLSSNFSNVTASNTTLDSSSPSMNNLTISTSGTNHIVILYLQGDSASGATVTFT